MSRLLKIIAIWLIACLIPLQGYASVSMLNCMQQSSSSQSVETTAHSHAHTHSALEKDAHAKHLSDQSAQCKDSYKHACNHCVKCSACCSGFTFTSSNPSLFQHQDTAKTNITYYVSLFISFIPSGLERPPRQSLI